jgi:hypothetical protein
MEGVKFWTKVKTVTARWPEGDVGDSSFVIPTMGLSREFEFTVTGSRRFPTFDALRGIACQIFDEVFDAIPLSRNFLNGKVGAYLRRDMADAG